MLVAIWISSTSIPSAWKKPLACATRGATKLSERLGMPTRTFSSVWAGGAAGRERSTSREKTAARIVMGRFSILAVEAVDEAALVERFHEARIDEQLRLDAPGLRVARHLGQHGAHALDAGIGLGRRQAGEIFVRLLGDAVVLEAQELLDHLHALALVRLVKSDPLDEGAEKAPHRLRLLADEGVGRGDVVVRIDEAEGGGVAQLGEALALGQQRVRRVDNRPVDRAARERGKAPLLVAVVHDRHVLRRIEPETLQHEAGA